MQVQRFSEDPCVAFRTTGSQPCLTFPAILIVISKYTGGWTTSPNESAFGSCVCVMSRLGSFVIFPLLFCGVTLPPSQGKTRNNKKQIHLQVYPSSNAAAVAIHLFWSIFCKSTCNDIGDCKQMMDAVHMSRIRVCHFDECIHGVH